MTFYQYFKNHNTFHSLERKVFFFVMKSPSIASVKNKKSMESLQYDNVENLWEEFQEHWNE